jgi:hypothetical protein
MQKMTLLQIVQNILSALSSDQVTSITDTVESTQVAEEVRTTFYELYGNRDIATFEGLVTLESPGSSSTPHILTCPENVSYIRWLKYRDYRDTSGDLKYRDIQYLEPEEFIRRIVEQPDPASSVSVQLVTTSPATYPIANDRCPQFYTILDDDQTLVFDAFDADEESYLTGSNSLVWAVQFKEFTLTDSFIPPIDANFFPHFLHECRSACFVNIKEVANSKEEQRARRQLVRSQNRIGRTTAQKKGVLSHVDYSRKR